MNDGLRTDIFLRYRPQTIACACIDLASKSIAVSGIHDVSIILLSLPMLVLLT